MAEYCRECAERYLGAEEAKHCGGACKPGETFWDICEGCGEVVEMDHEGRRVGKEKS